MNLSIIHCLLIRKSCNHVMLTLNTCVNLFYIDMDYEHNLDVLVFMVHSLSLEMELQSL